MVDSERAAVVCTHPVRDHAEALVAVLREHGIMAGVFPSDRHPGEWDVLVPTRVADRVHQIVSALLALG
jgi:hypothetical protein